MEELKDRIKLIRKKHKMTQVEFGEKIGVKGNTITNYENGLRNPTNTVLLSICKEFNVNINWLRYGKGDMEVTQSGKLNTYLGSIFQGDDEFIKDLIEVYMELDQNSKDALKLIAERMADKIKSREK